MLWQRSTRVTRLRKGSIGSASALRLNGGVKPPRNEAPLRRGSERLGGYFAFASRFRPHPRNRAFHRLVGMPSGPTWNKRPSVPHSSNWQPTFQLLYRALDPIVHVRTRDAKGDSRLVDADRSTRMHTASRKSRACHR